MSSTRNTNRVVGEHASLLYIAVSVLLLVRLAWPSALQEAAANLAIHHSLVSAGPDLRLQFPFGSCNTARREQSVFSSIQLPVNASPYLAGLVYFRSNDLPAAEHSFEIASSIGNAKALATHALGVTRILEGDLTEAINAWHGASSVISLLSSGKECVDAGNSTTAMYYYEAALKVVSVTDLDAYRQLVLFFAGQPDLDKFERALQGYLSLADPNTLDYYRTLGFAYLTHNEPQKSIEFLEVASVLAPNAAWVWDWSGRAAYQLGRHDQARNFFGQAIRLSPQAADLYTYIGHTYLVEQAYPQAVEWYEKALTISPENNWALSSLAKLQLLQGHDREALALAIRVLQNSSSNSAALTIAAQASIKLGEWMQAKQWITRAIEQDPTDLEYRWQMENVCRVLQDQECRQDSYMAILKIDPGNVEARTQLDSMQGKQP